MPNGFVDGQIFSNRARAENAANTAVGAVESLKDNVEIGFFDNDENSVTLIAFPGISIVDNVAIWESEDGTEYQFPYIEIGV